MRRKLIFIAPVAIAGFTLFIGLGGLVVRALWNWLLPTLFGWPHVTFWQALGLLVLCRILFGGFRLAGGSGPGIRRRMHENWERMTPEERDALRQRMRARWGWTRPEASPASADSKGQ